MRKTRVVMIAGVLTAGVVLAVYMHFRTEGTQGQTPAAANQTRVMLGEQRSAAPQTSAPPRSFTERAPIVLNSLPPAADLAPVHHIGRRRTGATRQFELPTHSDVVQKSSTQAAEPTAFSKAEQNSQATQSRSDLATQNKPAATAVLLPPSSPSPTSLPVQPVAAPFAMLHATGKMLLDGKLSDDSVIVSGESIETPPDTYATLVREKSEVLIRPNSRLRITERGVELERGQVLVTTTTGLPVQANRLTITPSANGSAKYEVLDIAESPQVKTYEGSVLVKD